MSRCWFAKALPLTRPPPPKKKLPKPKKKDIYANGGGVVVSFFEWVQNMQNFRWEEDEIQARLDRYMTDAYSAMHKVASSRKLPLRAAAYTLAVGRVAAAEVHRGFD